MAIAVTELCMAPHQLYQQSGRPRVRMEDGTEVEAGNAETTAVAPGHDAWVMGDEPAAEDDQTIASLNHRRSDRSTARVALRWRQKAASSAVAGPGIPGRATRNERVQWLTVADGPNCLAVGCVLLAAPCDGW